VGRPGCGSGSNPDMDTNEQPERKPSGDDDAHASRIAEQLAMFEEDDDDE